MCYGEEYIKDFSSYNTALSELAGREVRLASVEELKAELKKYPIKEARQERVEKKIEKLEKELENVKTHEEELSARQEEADMAYEEADLAADHAKEEAMSIREKLVCGQCSEEESIDADNEAEKLMRQALSAKNEADRIEGQLQKLALTKNDLLEQIEALREKLEADDEAGGTKIDFKDGGAPWYKLLVHPKVLECAQSLMPKVKSAGGEISGIQSTAVTCLNLYQDPIVQENTSTTDFLVEDLLVPEKPVSFYLVIPPNDIERMTPLVRLLINLMLNRLIRDMKNKEQKLAALRSKLREKGMRVLTGKKEDKVHNRQFAGGKGA